ncbi:hypothetical protein ACFQMF_01545 [Halorubrum rutilum]|uniref:Uncharacterized protein n=1 Tax=Halorubrum rutilum TaxID=1364933 RepID=A0ABD6AGS1_9EURY|nr:hypothetical protein [Halorubrum rutilum]
MAELTDAERFGTGIEFEQSWDVVASETGSIGKTSGLAVLERDLAFALGRAAREEDLRGRRFNPNLREDVRILVRSVVSDIGRIQQLVDATITQPDDARRTAEVQLVVEATTGTRGEFVFTV